LNFDVGLGIAQAVILGAITAVGGGTMRDVLIGRIPVVLRTELYAIPALAGALVVVMAEQLGAPDVPAAVGAAALCFGIRMLGVRFDLNAPDGWGVASHGQEKLVKADKAAAVPPSARFWPGLAWPGLAGGFLP
jgi:uncharacterized membrane protein YeiH